MLTVLNAPMFADRMRQGFGTRCVAAHVPTRFPCFLLLVDVAGGDHGQRAEIFPVPTLGMILGNLQHMDVTRGVAAVGLLAAFALLVFPASEVVVDGVDV